MKDIFIVGKFTIKETIKKKAFIITNIILLGIILVIVNIPNIIKIFEIDVENFIVERIKIIDPTNVFEGSISNYAESDALYTIDVLLKDVSEDNIIKDIEESETDSIIYISNENNLLDIKYYSSNGILNSNASTIINTLNTIYKDIQISRLDLTNEQLEAIYPQLNIENIATDENSSSVDSETSMGVGSVLSMVLFLTVYLFAYQVSTAVTTEKTSKIVETLLTSTKPKNIILGKTYGVGLLGLLQIITLLLFTFISAYLFLPNDIINDLIASLNIATPLIIISMLYFILAYLLFAFLFALSGAMVNRIEDVQIANMPINLVLVIGFYLGYFTLFDTTGILNVISSYLPISSAFSMPTRYVLESASISSVIISLVILVVTIIIIAKVSIRIYSNAILNNGSKMNMKDLIKLYKQKN